MTIRTSPARSPDPTSNYSPPANGSATGWTTPHTVAAQYAARGNSQMAAMFHYAGRVYGYGWGPDTFISPSIGRR